MAKSAEGLLLVLGRAAKKPSKPKADEKTDAGVPEDVELAINEFRNAKDDKAAARSFMSAIKLANMQKD